MLDALALAGMGERSQLARIAALWCRAHQDRPPYNREEIGKWVKQEFGPVLGSDRRDRLCRDLADETRRQIRLRKLRAKRNREIIDPALTPAGSSVRVGKLLQSRLGPARRWAGSKLITGDEHCWCHYIDGGTFSGLVAGLIPIEMRTRGVINPNLLVYRYRWDEPMTRYVPSHITTVTDAFVWLIPPEAAEFLQLPDSRVEHDGEAQTVTLITQFGSKVLPWRSLTS
jgi:hypothetical protein